MTCPTAFRYLALRFALAATCGAAMVTALSAFSAASAATTLKTLHAFCLQTNCPDGANPDGGLIQDSTGTLYGTAGYGGKYGQGVVFELVPNVGKTKWKYRAIKNFCAKINCTDGADPNGELVMDVNGNLYGTTAAGGKYNDGAIFQLTKSGTRWAWKILHSFCESCTSDSYFPNGGFTYLTQHSGGLWEPDTVPAYGVTWNGGQYGNGVAYQLLHSGGSSWTYTVIHSFNQGASANELVQDDNFNLWGTTNYGGTNGYGLLFELTYNGSTWSGTTLHNFCPPGNCEDGAYPTGRLLLDGANIVGSTGAGGLAGCNQNYGCGTVFEYSGSTYSVLYTFCSVGNCDGGSAPQAGVIMDASGNLYGTTLEGGNNDEGTAFELSEVQGSWAETVLASICSGSCSDDGYPYAPLTLDPQNGNLYGTAIGDYVNETPGGSVFELVR